MSVKVISGTSSVAEIKEQLRRQAAMKNATWPAVLLKDLIRLVDDHDRLTELEKDRASA